MPYIGKSPELGVRTRYYYTVSAGATSVSGSDDNSKSLRFSDGEYVDVSLNGVALVAGTDYNTTTANTIAGLSAMSANDVVEVVVYDVFSVFSGDISGDLSVGGSLTFDGVFSAKGGAVFNEDSADVDFRVESNDNTEMFSINGGNNRVGIGCDADYLTEIRAANGDHTSSTLAITNSQAGGYGSALTFVSERSDDNAHSIAARIRTEGAENWGSDGAVSSSIIFETVNDNTVAERARLWSDGRLAINTSNLLSGADRYGVNANTGDLAVSSNAATALYVNRENDDGDLVRLSQDRNTEGNISVSGSTVSYNAFTGSHWSRLSDNSKPTILRGTVLETIDEMCDWYQAEYTIPATVNAPETTGKDSIALPSGKKVGDTITHTKDGVDYTAKIIQEKDIKHVKCKISDTADSSSVYGVFMAWDNDDDTVNDMYVNALGTAVIRIHKDITVAKGDLVVSNGDGTAKKQDDDIIRSKTIGKVLANIKQETYSDGSYTVPCALYCG